MSSSLRPGSCHRRRLSSTSLPTPPTPQVKFLLLAIVAVVSSVLWPSSAALVFGVYCYPPLFLLVCDSIICKSTGCNCMHLVFCWVLLLWALKTTADAITASRRLRIKLTIGAITFPFFVLVYVQQKCFFFFLYIYNGGLMSFTLHHNSILK